LKWFVDYLNEVRIGIKASLQNNIDDDKVGREKIIGAIPVWGR